MAMDFRQVVHYAVQLPMRVHPRPVIFRGSTNPSARLIFSHGAAREMQYAVGMVVYFATSAIWGRLCLDNFAYTLGRQLSSIYGKREILDLRQPIGISANVGNEPGKHQQPLKNFHLSAKLSRIEEPEKSRT
jgi:hypothetical protein